jgi:hypothetical protein
MTPFLHILRLVSFSLFCIIAAACPCAMVITRQMVAQSVASHNDPMVVLLLFGTTRIFGALAGTASSTIAIALSRLQRPMLITAILLLVINFVAYFLDKPPPH